MRHEVMLKSNQQKLLHIIFITQLFLDVLLVFFMVVGFICVSCLFLCTKSFGTLFVFLSVFSRLSLFVSQRLCVDGRLYFC